MPHTEVIVIRHGETFWNLEGRWQGHYNSPLTEKGLMQAEAVARRFGTTRFAALYSSDLDRAIQTAKEIADKVEHEIIIEERLRERSLGIFEGLTMIEIEEKYPEDALKYKSFDPEYIIPRGESLIQFSKRVTDCFRDLTLKHIGERIVIITHGGVLNQIFRFVVGLPLYAPRNYTLLNSSVNTFLYNFDKKTWLLKTWGDISHIIESQVLDDV